MRRVAVVLFNLGGPDSPDAVQPFLHNLFADPAILRVPGWLRWLLARFIARRRAPVARAIYARIGGRSPILPQSLEQAAALQAALGELGEVRVFVAMRYWHPRAAAVVREVAEWRPDAVVLLPLYPQYSTTTSASSLTEWRDCAKAADLHAPLHVVCCYAEAPGLVSAHAEALLQRLAEAEQGGPTRVLFSAHGLPQKVVDAGDPYQWQVERTVEAVVRQVRQQRGGRTFDFSICYQSRVGPLKWIGPSTEAEISRAAASGLGLIVVPIAFVSEHSETLVELDIEYRERAHQAGARQFLRIPALGVADGFIGTLSRAVRQALARPSERPCAFQGKRACPARFKGCAMQAAT
ncbi:MAG: ferrochelatase [Alphaproteobacteria bacterium]|nr:ferrochelatase [Alphaproteobacteria bacterium]